MGKTALTANLAGFLADTDQQYLLVDADIEPTLSSYYPLAQQANGAAPDPQFRQGQILQE